ncbi:hypothetical protein IQ06DRAFT_348301 [Phaeosphaeriaceae sp. SRC1lsM3a]|nr:hypothetical protein IQ06DRAFT_348301 [Stagonospora sp. SRC1lsM3a]
MHDQAPVAPPLAADHHHQHQHHHHHDDIHNPAPPDYPPPSYDDATNPATAPLLAGAPPGYGTTFPDQSSVASSDLDESEITFAKLVGQIFTVLVFIGIIYGFWIIVTAH